MSDFTLLAVSIYLFYNKRLDIAFLKLNALEFSRFLFLFSSPIFSTKSMLLRSTFLSTKSCWMFFHVIKVSLTPLLVHANCSRRDCYFIQFPIRKMWCLKRLKQYIYVYFFQLALYLLYDKFIWPFKKLPTTGNLTCSVRIIYWSFWSCLIKHCIENYY